MSKEREARLTKNLFGKSESESKMQCEVCFTNDATEKAIIPLWNYGKRVSKMRNVCKSCLDAHKAGNL